MISTLEVGVVVGFAAFAIVVSIYHLLRAAQLREELISHAENLGADPAVLSDPLRRSSFLVRWADRYDRSEQAAGVRELLRRAYLPWKPSDYRVYRYALGLGTLGLAWLAFDLPVIPSILLAAAAYVVAPKLYLRGRRHAYVYAFEAQLVEIAQILANALRAGMSIQQAIGQVAERVPEPAAGEFRQTNNELMLGDSLTQTLGRIRERVRSRDLDVMVNAILVQHQAGGNLARVLAAMANILTERQRLASEIRSLTAEARFSALIIMCMPVILIFMLRDSPIGETLFGTMIGWGLLAAFAAVQIGVYALVQRVARIEV
jgi:tight adherence protein B